MIITVKILEVIAKFKSFIKGPALWCRGELDDEPVGVVIYARDFPIGLIAGFVVGEDLSCFLRSAKENVKAEALPLDHQPPKILGRLIGLVMNMANEAGQSELNDLPDVTQKEINGPLPPTPQPEANELDRLFDLSVESQITSQEEEEDPL